MAPDVKAEAAFTSTQREQLQRSRENLAKRKAEVDLSKAALDAVDVMLVDQELRISSLNAEIAKKEEELGNRGLELTASPRVEESKDALPTTFLAGVTRRIVIIEGDKGSGTGFLCVCDGRTWIYTAAHVLSGQAKIAVRDYKGRIYRDFDSLECAEGVDLVRLKPKDLDLEGLEIVSPEEVPEIGELIVAVGNSLGAGSLSGEPGRVMSVQDDMWEVDAEIIPGNSGGPVLSIASGKVVGIVTHLTIARRRAKEQPNPTTDVKRFAARLDKKWEWREMPVSRFVNERAHIDKMDRDSSIAWASIFLMHTGPKAPLGKQPDPKLVETAQSILARDRNHIQVQRVDEWLKRYRGAGSVQRNQLIDDGNKIIRRNLEEIKLKDDAPKSTDFSWYHRQLYDSELEWRQKLTDDPEED